MSEAEYVDFYYSDQPLTDKSGGTILRARAEVIAERKLGEWGPGKKFIILHCRKGMLFGGATAGPIASRMAAFANNKRWNKQEEDHYKRMYPREHKKKAS